MDEPMTGLDSATRNGLGKLLKMYRDGGNSIFFTSHMLTEVDSLCDRIAVLNEGRVVFIGSPVSLREQQGESSLENAFLKCVKKI
jgi:ABC-2 type transport system ATP-binding protein